MSRTKIPIYCDLCNKEFQENKTVTSHMKLVHEMVVPKRNTQVKCEICQLKFPNSYLESHKLKVHYEIVQPRHKCDFCNKDFEKAH